MRRAGADRTGADATRLAAAFGVGTPVGPVERIGSGWGGHNVLWRLDTTEGRWAIKQVGRAGSPDPDAALAIELAACAGGAIGSHRDLYPTNLMRLETGGLVLVDWDAAGPVIPHQEVACFALVFGDRGDGHGYAEAVVRAFIDGYRRAGGRFAFSGPGELALHVQGQVWWTEQNVRLALASPEGIEQGRLAAMLLDGLVGLEDRLPEMAAMLSGGA